MMEEFGGAIDGGLGAINSGESGEVTQEALERVTEDARRAAQAGAQIRADQNKNGQLVLFLEFLFREVQSDEIWGSIVELCAKPDSSGKNVTLSLPELIAFFAPFYLREIEEYQIETIIGALPRIEGEISKEHYIGYVNVLRGGNQFMQSMPKPQIAKLIVALLGYFGYISEHEKKSDTILQSIEQLIR